MHMIDFNLLFFDISTGEIFIVLILIFIVFGPSRIPELAKKIGRGVYEVKRASNEIKREIDSEVRRIERDVDIKKHVKDKAPKPEESKAEDEDSSKENTDN